MRVLICIAVLTAGADKVSKATAETELDELAKATNTACGTTLAATVEWASFEGVDWSGKDLKVFCGPALTELASFCSGAASKAYIKGTVKKYSCRYGGAGKRALTVKAGAVEQRVDFDASNNDTFARAELMKSL